MSTDLSTEPKDPTFQAFALLRTVFTVAPIVFGIDRFGRLARVRAAATIDA